MDRKKDLESLAAEALARVMQPELPPRPPKAPLSTVDNMRQMMETTRERRLKQGKPPYAGS